MKQCAYCGRENDADAPGCRECGTKEFVRARDTSSVLVEWRGVSPPNQDAAPNAGSATPSGDPHVGPVETVSSLGAKLVLVVLAFASGFVAVAITSMVYIAWPAIHEHGEGLMLIGVIPALPFIYLAVVLLKKTGWMTGSGIISRYLPYLILLTVIFLVGAALVMVDSIWLSVAVIVLYLVILTVVIRVSKKPIPPRANQQIPERLGKAPIKDNPAVENQAGRRVLSD